MKFPLFSLLTLILFLSCSQEYQVSDDDFTYNIGEPAYAEGGGPVILVDAAHNNFHTIDGRYSPFAKLLRSDGYVVRQGRSEITVGLLNSCRIFVTSVAMPVNGGSAYKDEEIDILKKWVEDGGSLFLITDHHPDVPAVVKLAEVFGVKLNNGYALEGNPKVPKPIIFNMNDNTLTAHPVTSGRNEDEEIDFISTFTGCAFTADTNYKPLLVFRQGALSWMPEEAWKFDSDTERVDIEGWYQGAVAETAEGRIAVFGEAAMFTAQLFGKDRVPSGLNSPEARYNAQFLLNIIHWLSSEL
ncbi:MAG: hypothetical protein GY863_19845 [bacterium]|nr:hypothetical protein [bacterium]